MLTEKDVFKHSQDIDSTIEEIKKASKAFYIMFGDDEEWLSLLLSVKVFMAKCDPGDKFPICAGTQKKDGKKTITYLACEEVEGDAARYFGENAAHVNECKLPYEIIKMLKKNFGA
jgi:hypothetical protein